MQIDKIEQSHILKYLQIRSTFYIICTKWSDRSVIFNTENNWSTGSDVCGIHSLSLAIFGGGFAGKYLKKQKKHILFTCKPINHLINKFPAVTKIH